MVSLCHAGNPSPDSSHVCIEDVHSDFESDHDFGYYKHDSEFDFNSDQVGGGAQYDDPEWPAEGWGNHWSLHENVFMD